MDKNNLLYITDENENRTAVIVPINRWEEIKETLLALTTNDLSKDDSFINYINDLPIDGFSRLTHYQEIAHLLSKMQLYTKEQWNDIYSKYYQYFDSLNKNDIQLLYFFRKMLYLPNNVVELEDHLDLLKNKFKLFTYAGNEISLNDYKILIEKFSKLNEISFLQYFSTTYQINLNEFDSIRLKRKAERDRLFIFDTLTFLEKSFEFIKMTIDDENTITSMNIGKKQIIDNIATILYNGNKSQVYRANQEALLKINNL